MIKGLDDHYNWEIVTFNSDTTFIYCVKGNGKMIVLNIIEAINAGEIFKLFNYNLRKYLWVIQVTKSRWCPHSSKTRKMKN